MLLKVQGLTKVFGGLTAVGGLDLSVEKGQILGLIGPNGAGKTTAFNCISGALRPTQGSIQFKGRDVTGLKPYQMARLGMARTFQSNRFFKSLTVSENIHHALDFRQGSGQSTATERVEYLLGALGLSFVAYEEAQNLSHGHQRMLGIALALALSPQLLLLDEPATGMNPQEKAELQRVIFKIRESGVTLILIEHNMQMVMSLCDRIVVINYGKKIAEGVASHVANDPQVVEAYLGKGW